MKEIELCNGVTVKFAPENSDETLNISLNDFHKFELYGSITLNDVFDTIDRSPSDIEDFNIEEILEEIDYDDDFDYETFINENLGNKHRRFLSCFLAKVNEEILNQYPDKIITGEENLYGEIIFYSENQEEEIERVIKLKSDIIDNDNQLDEVLSNLEINEETFYILEFMSSYED
jgi:hypothetical protein